MANGFGAVMVLRCGRGDDGGSTGLGEAGRGAGTGGAVGYALGRGGVVSVTKVVSVGRAPRFGLRVRMASTCKGGTLGGCASPFKNPTRRRSRLTRRRGQCIVPPHCTLPVHLPLPRMRARVSLP